MSELIVQDISIYDPINVVATEIDCYKRATIIGYSVDNEPTAQKQGNFATTSFLCQDGARYAGHVVKNNRWVKITKFIFSDQLPVVVNEGSYRFLKISIEDIKNKLNQYKDCVEVKSIIRDSGCLDRINESFQLNLKEDYTPQSFEFALDKEDRIFYVDKYLYRWMYLYRVS